MHTTPRLRHLTTYWSGHLATYQDKFSRSIGVLKPLSPQAIPKNQPSILFSFKLESFAFFPPKNVPKNAKFLASLHFSAALFTNCADHFAYCGITPSFRWVMRYSTGLHSHACVSILVRSCRTMWSCKFCYRSGKQNAVKMKALLCVCVCVCVLGRNSHSTCVKLLCCLQPLLQPPPLLLSDALLSV